MHRFPLIVVAAGLLLHFPGWLWHDAFHAHEGLETLRTQAVFYLATAVVLFGALLGLMRRSEPRWRWIFAAVLGGALVETAGWIWDFAAHYAGYNSAAAHTTVFVGAAVAVLGALATLLTRSRRSQA